MATNADLREVVQFLSTTPEPLWLLEHLRDEPSPLKDIADALSLSQSTIQPSLDALVERHWVEQTTDGYRITPTGTFVTMEYLAILDTLEQIADSERFIRELPLEAISPYHSVAHTPEYIDAHDSSSS